MRKIKYLISFLCLLGVLISTSSSAWAATDTDANGDVWNYTLVSNEARSVYMSSDNTRSSVVIPSSLGGYPVTSIGGYGVGIFKQTGSYPLVTSVVIPSTVTRIEDVTFINCTGLTSIVIPNSVTYIGFSAFNGNTSLTSVSIPDSVQSIGPSAFAGCTALTSFDIPNAITSLVDYLFNGCTNLSTIDIPATVTSVGSSVFDGTAWLQARKLVNPLVVVNNCVVNGTSCVGDVVIPHGIKQISGSSFANCSTVTSVTMPDTVTSWGTRVFVGCTNLSSVVLSNSLTTIASSAFEGCSKLTTISIPSSILSLSSSSFKNCTSLTSIVLPSTVTSVGSSSFSGCTSLANITFLNPSTTITNSAAVLPVTTVMKGLTGSTAQTYATTYSRTFVVYVPGNEVVIVVDSPPTTIDVTVTVSATVTINPNTGVVSSPIISIVNNTNAPITAYCTGLSADGAGYFTLVSSSKYPDWSKLNKLESKDLAITLALNNGWKTKINDTLSTGNVGTLSGTIGPETTATVSITSVYHGNSFPSAQSSSFPLSWVFELE